MRTFKLWLLFLQIPAALCNKDPEWFADLPGRFAVDESVFTPLEDLSSISNEQFTTLTHPVFPRHTVRIKKSDFCDPTVGSYTGYVDIGARHLFFYFFESRSDPDKDDVIFWTNGGPGCSSSMGLFMELGPCKIKDGNTTVPNPFSWNTNANIFFIDQPVGTGFSYADYGGEISSTEEAAKDIASFVAIFFEHFVKFRGRGFHMAGESYAGRLLPIYASVIYDHNTRLVEAGITPINLQSVMIGNGLTDVLPQIISNYHFACENISVPPTLSIDACVKIKSIIPRCQKWMKASCIDTFDEIDCPVASEFCLQNLWGVYSTSGMNPYDVRKKCDGKYAETMCYPYLEKNINSYLDLPSTRAKLGVDLTGNFSSCNLDIYVRFFGSADFIHGQTQYYAAALLERGVRVLAYAGIYDFVCNWIGIRDFTLNLEWSGQEKFGQEELREWTVNGRKAGAVRMFGGLAFATIDGGGHMAPYDQPEESLALVQRWLAKRDI